MPLAALLTAWLAGCSSPARPLELWLWSGANLADSASVARTEAVWRRAAAAGYGTVVLADPKFSRLARQDSAYFRRLARLRAVAAELHLALVPAVMPVGRGQGAALEVNPDLAEALPVERALFEVRGGVAQLVPDPPVALAARPAQRSSGVRLRADTLVIPHPARAERARWHVRVSPWRNYHVSVRLRTTDFTAEPRLHVRGEGRELAFAELPRRADAWTRFDVTLNSQGARELTVVLGCGGRGRGTLEFADWRIEECGPVNLVRRATTPFVAEGLVEGRDFEPVRDSLMGASPWRGQFDRWHAPPVIRVHRPDGTRFRASWWQAAVVGRDQVALCLADTATLAQLADEARRVRAAFDPPMVLLQHDEIRALGGDPACRAAGGDPGAILAANVRACAAALAPARVCVWSDMFDPLHNAVRDYFLVRGDLRGGMAGLDTSMVVIDWGHAHPRASLAWFDRRGFRQVWAGYYDGRPDQVRAVLPLLHRTPGAFAVMYTTWQDRYDDLEAFAREVRGGR